MNTTKFERNGLSVTVEPTYIPTKDDGMMSGYKIHETGDAYRSQKEAFYFAKEWLRKEVKIKNGKL